MLEVTSQANTKLVEYMQSNNVNSALRVFLTQGGCSGPALALALDEKKPGDEEFSFSPLTFLVEKALLTQCGTITIDFIDSGSRSGFSVLSSTPLPGGGGCSSGSCGTGGCGC